MRVSLPISTVGRRALLAQHLADGVAETQHEVGRDRRVADRAADSVGAEVGSAHGMVALPGLGAIIGRPGAAACQTASAATVAATSWTRTMRAPRSHREHGRDDAGGVEPGALGRRCVRPAAWRRRPLAAPASTCATSRRAAARRVASSSRWRASISRFCAAVLPKPMPGSTTMRSRSIAADGHGVDPLPQEGRRPRRRRRRSWSGSASSAAFRACASGRRRSSGARQPPRARPALAAQRCR